MAKKKAKEFDDEKKEVAVAEEWFEDAKETKKDEPYIAVGIVDGCEKLNVRKMSSLSSDIVTVLNNGDKVEINATFAETHDGDWHQTKDGNYVMKQFIKLQ